MNQPPDELGFASPLPVGAALANPVLLHLHRLGLVRLTMFRFTFASWGRAGQPRFASPSPAGACSTDYVLLHLRQLSITSLIRHPGGFLFFRTFITIITHQLPIKTSAHCKKNVARYIS
ncbi:hypothetical protein [Aeromonas sobria]|uniref:hypothetical protein n=1 Tax=Aeromonas sobria TaxID=646 RepID=UPI00111794BD|nr:hypothetical protein [Aeromonas sobria]